MDEQVEKKWNALLFGVRRSIRYHQRRQRFFERFHAITNAMIVVFGSATVTTLLTKIDSGIIGTLAATIVTLFAVMDLIANSCAMACKHSELARRFIALEQELNLTSPSEEAYNSLYNKRLTIETDEPPILRILDAVCHNELLRAMGYPKEREAKIVWYQRLLAQFFDIREHTIRASNST